MPTRLVGLARRLLKGSGKGAKPGHLAALNAASLFMGRWYLLFLPNRARSVVARRGHAIVVRGRGTLSWDSSVRRWVYPRGLSPLTDLPGVLVLSAARTTRRASTGVIHGHRVPLLQPPLDLSARAARGSSRHAPSGGLDLIGTGRAPGSSVARSLAPNPRGQGDLDGSAARGPTGFAMLVCSRQAALARSDHGLKLGPESDWDGTGALSGGLRRAARGGPGWPSARANTLELVAPGGPCTSPTCSGTPSSSTGASAARYATCEGDRTITGHE